jgi:hypothetical protein
VLAAFLIAGAGLKLARPRSSQAALETFGVPGGRPRWAVWATVIATEFAVAGGLAAGSAVAAYAGAILMAVFAATLLGAIWAGRAGRPCGCFGPRSRVSGRAVARACVLAAGLAALPALDRVEPSADGWLAIGLGVALAGVVVLAVVVAALAREIGALRLALPPQSALEIAEEGPQLGSRTDLLERLQPHEGAGLALAVFTSDSCAVCRSLDPALRFMEGDPFLALRVFDEERDADAWREAEVPGSPYAIAVGLDGRVLAKGTFNSLAQLESVLATAQRRERDPASA